MAISLHSDAVDTPPLPSSTVMVLRDALDGLEVLLMRRHADSGVLGGAHVFPGGKLDAADRAWSSLACDASPEVFRDALAEPELEGSMALGLYAAAVRETFEECGLLLGLPPEAALRVADLRERVRLGRSLAEGLQDSGLPVAFSALRPWSRWVTPRVPTMMRKRFDTRFFVAVAPPEQTVAHCTFETTEAVWLSPRAALSRCWSGEIDLAPPQIMSLGELSRLESVAAAMALAGSRRPPLIEPESLDVAGDRVICYPGDPQHSVREAFWAGPTRLTYRNKRFEVEGGLSALTG